MNLNGSYKCDCPPEWTGDICQTGEGQRVNINGLENYD